MKKRIIIDINSKEDIELNKETIHKILETVTESIDADSDVKINVRNKK